MPGFCAQALGLVDLIYQQPGDEEHWDRIFSAVSKALGLNTIQILGFDLSSQASRAIRTLGIDPSWIQRYEAYYAETNPIIRHNLLPRIPCASVYTTEPRIAAVWYPGEYFNDFLLPQDCYYAGGCILALTGTIAQTLSVTWSKRHGPASRGERKLLEVLTPHLANRIQFEQRIASLEDQKRSLDFTLDVLGAAYLVLDGKGCEVFANRRARELLLTGDGLKLTHTGRLVAEAPRSASALRRVVGDALGVGPTGAPRPPGAVTIERPSGRRPYTVFVWPYVAPFDHQSDEHGALVLINDPDDEPDQVGRHLARLFDLTPAEVRVAVLLLQGLSPKEIAERNEVSLNTVRSQVKNLLLKTDTRRQSDLIIQVHRALGRLVR